MKHLLLVLAGIMLFTAPVSAGGYKEQGAWNFLSPLDKQFLLNRESLRLSEKGGLFEGSDNHFITQINTNIGNITNIDGNGNNVNQDNSGDQNADNNVQSDSYGNLSNVD